MSSLLDPSFNSLLESNFDPRTLVLEGRQLFGPNETGPQYGLGVWDLTPAKENPTPHERGVLTFDFGLVPAPYREEVKRYCASRLFDAPPQSMRARLVRPAATTVGKEFRELVRLTQFLVETQVLIPRDTTQADLDRFIGRLRRKGVSDVHLGKLVGTFQKVYSYRSLTKSNWLNFNPWAGRRPFKSEPGAENKTQRIPEGVFRAIAERALFYIETASVDIEAASLEQDRLANTDIRPADRSSESWLREYLDSLRGEGRQLPGVIRANARGSSGGDKKPVLNVQAVARKLGTAIPSGSHLRKILDEAAEELGVAVGEYDTSIQTHPAHGRPWRKPLSRSDIKDEIKQLKTACLILCLLTGMRLEEVQALRPGCIKSQQLGQGAPTRYWVRSDLSKGREESTEEDWIVLPEVVEAIRIAERFTQGPFLFSGWKKCSDQKVKANAGSITYYINHFASRGFVGKTGVLALPEIPRHDGDQWHFSATQFRRTIAAYIARQPFGILAGALQFKHLSAATFEGYAGFSRSGFRSEIISERQLAGTEIASELYVRTKAGGRIGGPGGQELADTYAEIREQAGDFPGKVVDDQRLRSMLRNVGTDIYVGPGNLCWFHEDRAMCTAGEPEAAAPAISACRPDLCGNSCVTKDQIGDWETAVTAAKKMRSERGLPPVQIEILDDWIESVSGTIDEAVGE